MLRTLLLLALLSIQSLAIAQVHERYRLVRIDSPTRAERDLLATLDCDHLHAEAGSITVALSGNDLERLRASGADVTVLIDDLEQYYAARAARELEGLRKSPDAHVMGSDAPEHFAPGSAGGFYTLEELDQTLQSMTTLYPEYAHPFSIGRSTEGREIRGIRISMLPGTDTLAPEVLYTAMHHAREPGGMMSLVYTIWTLLEKAGSDPEIQSLLASRALYFIPMLNPDGYAFNLRQAPDGGGMWRRNMRAQGDSGVDLNRNYGPLEYWDRDNGGSSDDPRSALYRGPVPFSEPETQALRDFVLQHRFIIAINHHTFSNLLIWPFDWSRYPIADSSYYRAASRQLAAYNGYAPGNDIVGVGYSTRGVSDEWLYSYGNPATTVISWSPESGSLDDGFWPLPSRIIPMAAETLPMNLLAAWIAGAAPRVTAWERIDSAGAPMLRLTITNIGRAPMTGTARIAIDGAGDAVAIPALGSLGSTVLRLQIPPGLATGDSARPEVTLRVEYGAESIGQTIRPMVHPMESVMEADFEGPVFNWSLDGWGLEELPGRGRVMGDSPGGLYRQGTGENILRWMAPISLHDLDAAELRLDARWVILARDHEGSIEARRGSNAPWEKLDAEYLQLPYVEPGTLKTRMRGDLEEWNRLKVDLDRFVGEEIELRFVMTAEQGELDTTFDGIMLDNIAIVGTRSPSAHVAHPDARTRPAIHLYPNPFADHLELYLENTSADAKLTLVDALGRIVRRAQGARASFDTRDLPAGFYTAMASTRRGVLQQKVMLGR